MCVRVSILSGEGVSQSVTALHEQDIDFCNVSSVYIIQMRFGPSDNCGIQTRQ
jgi:hypothetical protein